MPLARIVCVSFLACSAFLLAGALAHQPTEPAPVLKSDFVPQSAGASLLSPSGPSPLDDAIAALAPERTRWLELTVSQKGKQDGAAFEAEIYCIVGPDDRLRWDMRVQVGKTVSRQRIVSNGRLLWLGRRVANAFPRGELLILPTETGVPDRAQRLEARHKLLAEKGFVTLQTLLTNVRQQMQNPQRQAGTWKGKLVELVTGGWHGTGSVPSIWSTAGEARRCNVYFDQATRMPFRLEWWTEAGPNRPSTLLWEMEIRNLVINRPLAPEAFAHTFCFATLYN